MKKKTSYEFTTLDLTICHLPKYEGESWVDVMARDPEYVEWVVWNVDLSDELEMYLLDLLEG